jgi:hypothetical protein
VVSVFFVPVSRRVFTQTARCDFCERPIEEVVATDHVPLEHWSPPEGMEDLLRRLGVARPADDPEVSADARLDSLLSATEEAASPGNVDITFGITTGALAGAVLGVPLGRYLFQKYELGASLVQRGILMAEPDTLNVVFVSILGGLVLGAIFGAILDGLFKPSRVALAKINAAYEKYDLDPTALEERSQSFSGRIRKAVRKVIRRQRS